MTKKLCSLMVFMVLSAYGVKEVHIDFKANLINNGVPFGKKTSFDYLSDSDGSKSWFGTALTVAAIAYTATLVYVLHARYLLNDLCAWNNWKNNIPLADLASMPQKAVYDMLSKSITLKYCCPEGTITMNLTQFLQDTTAEIESLSNYKSTAKILNSVGVSQLFFISSDSVRQADEKIKRLRFMQTAVASELEPNNCVRRLNLINYAYQTCQTWMQRVLGHHH